MTTGRPYILAETTWKTVREMAYDVAGLPWMQASPDTGIGDPGVANRQQGERYTSAVVERLSRFLVDLAAAGPDDLYEKRPTAHSGPRRRFLQGRGGGESDQAYEGM